MSSDQPLSPTLRRRAASLLLFLALMGTWEAAIRLLKVPAFILPAPSAVLAALKEGLSSGLYIRNLGVTFTEVVVGFALGSGLGFMLGVGIAINRYVAYFLYPYVIVVQSLPKVAIAPLIVLWFGLGISSKIASAALICFFAVMVNTIAGLRSVDEDRVDLMRSLGASTMQIFLMLRLPAALPFIMAGLEIALTFALIGAIVAEFLGAESGLGMLMQSMNFSMDVAGSFSVLVVLAILGLSLNQLIGVVRRRLIYWERSPGHATARPKEEPAKTVSP